MPSPYSSKGSIEDAEHLARNLGIQTLRIPITDIMESFDQQLRPAFEGRPSGKIYITAHVVQPGWVDITVRDDGVGIPQAHLDKVFDPFFTTKLGKGGSGLGLNIVYNLVTTTLGGRVQVSSTPGEGACFYLSLPLQMT